MWLPFALFSALISGGRRIYDKHLANIFGNFAMGFVVQGFSLIPHFILIFILPGGTDIGNLPWAFWWPLIIIWAVLYPIQTHFMYRAVREADISTVTPVMTMLPVFNIATSYVLLGEVPSVLGFFGILLIVSGTYMIMVQKGKSFEISKPALFMLIAMFCIAIGSSLDKISINASNPVFYAFVNTLGASLVFLILMHFYKEHDSFPKMKTKVLGLILLGVLQALSFVASMYAFKYGPVSYVLAIRAGSYVLAGLYAIFVLKEDFTPRKMLAFTCFASGVALLAFA